MPIVQCIDRFFHEVKNFNKSPERLEEGQIAWVPTLFYHPLPWVMKAQRESPRSHDDIKYEIRNMNEKDFRNEDRLPIHRINLKPTEELLAIKAKKRPCIMLFQMQWEELAQTDISRVTSGKDHLFEKIQVFVPVYSIKKYVGRIPRLGD